MKEKIEINSFEELDGFIKLTEKKYGMLNFYTASFGRFALLITSVTLLLIGYIAEDGVLKVASNIFAGLIFGHMYFWRGLHIGDYNDAPSLDKNISFFGIGFFIFYMLVLKDYYYLGEFLNSLCIQISGWFMSYLTFSIRADITYGAKEMSEYSMIEDNSDNKAKNKD